MTFVRSAASTHPGRKRPNNEDYVTYFEPNKQDELNQSGCIYILADGVGGASLGEQASQYAAQKILYEYYQHPNIPPANRLKNIIRQTGNEIFDFAEQQEHFMRMGTTVVVAVVRNGNLQVAHVGDSRAYLIQNEKVIQLTRDHSTVGEMMRDGVLTEDEAMHFQGRNLLSRSLGGHPDVRVDVTEEISFPPGSKLLLVSDGFSRYASREQISSLVTEEPPEFLVEKLVDFANQHGGADNISTILVEALVEPELARTIPMGQQPMPVDWDSIPTEHSLYSGKKSRGNFRKKITLIAVVVLVIPILILSVSFARNIIKFIFPPDATPTTIPNFNLMPPIISAPDETPTLIVLSTQSSEVLPFESATSTPMETVTSIPTFTASATVSQTLQPTITLADLDSVCEYTIQPEDLYADRNYGSLYILLQEKFGFLAGYPSGYFDFPSYASNVTSKFGEYETGGEVIKAGWIIILPDIPSELCAEKGGQPKE